MIHTRIHPTENMTDVTSEVVQLKETVESIDQGVIKKWLTSMIPGALSFLLCVVLAFIVYFIGTKIIKLVRRMVKKGLDVKNVDTGVKQFIDQLIKIIGYLILIVTILGLFGIQTSTVAAAIASLGLTAGLALQGSLSNFAGGVLILLLKPFVVGDYIMEHTHGNEGTVSEITIFYTKLNTIDNRAVIIPNGTLANSSMTNYTKNELRQLDLIIPISYSDDIRTAKELLEQLVSSQKHRAAEQPVNIFVKELGESSVNLGLRFWVPTAQYWPVYWEILERIKYAFDETGITIPFNAVDVTLHQEDTEDK